MGSGLSLGPEKNGTESEITGSKLVEKGLSHLHALVVRVTRGSHSHACPCHGRDRGSRSVKC